MLLVGLRVHVINGTLLVLVLANRTSRC